MGVRHKCPDRLQGNELKTTRELTANMLGVRGTGVTEATGKLQKDGSINYGSGRITVLNLGGAYPRVSRS